MGRDGRWDTHRRGLGVAGLSLPGSGRIRARARIPSGFNNASSSLIETITTFSPADADGDGLLDSWELAWWGTTVGHKADDDSDHDGFTDLQELAFGLDPTTPDAALAPMPIVEGGYLTITLTKHPGAACEVQSAGTVLPSSFSAATTTVLVDDATTLKVRDNFPQGTASARFLRVKVTAAP